MAVLRWWFSLPPEPLREKVELTSEPKKGRMKRFVLLYEGITGASETGAQALNDEVKKGSELGVPDAFG